MSTHSLTFSTPEMTLKKFALWLGEQVTAPDSHETVPRLILFLQEKKSGSSSHTTEPDIDDTFKPSGVCYRDVRERNIKNRRRQSPRC